jgi:hypothetical protein
MTRLLACPFCRQLFGPDEGLARCPDCGLELRPLEHLPPSAEARSPEDYVAPEDRRLPTAYIRRGRGLLLIIGALGLALFLMPWIVMRHPYDATLSGLDLARASAGWLWAGPVAWFVLLPLVATRRTIAQMRGVRLICTLFCSITPLDVAMLWAIPSHSGAIPVVYSFAWGAYASLVLGLAGMFVSMRFGGKLDDLPAVAYRDRQGRTEIESSAGETLH